MRGISTGGSTNRNVSTILLIAMAAAMPTLVSTSCVGGGPVDVKDYWPMQVGNYWELRSPDDSEVYTFEVIENHSMGETSAWKIQIALSRNGQQEFAYDSYYVWRQDFLVTTEDYNLMLELRSQAPIPDSPDIRIRFPRFVNSPSVPTVFIEGSPGYQRYFATGSLRDLAKYMMCPPLVPAINANRYPVPSHTQSVVRLIDDDCGSTPVLLGEILLAKDIGPADYPGRQLVYADVNGRIYQ